MCFVNAKGSIAPYVYQHRLNTALKKSYRFWAPFTLTLIKNPKESQFRAAAQAAWSFQDVIGCVIGMTFTPIVLLTLRRTQLQSSYLLGSLVYLALAIPNIYTYLYHRDLYLKYRVHSILFLRLFAWPLLFAAAFWNVPLTATPSAALMQLLVRSPIGMMIFGALMHRLEFRYHFVVQSMLFLVALLWIPFFCQSCSANSEIHQQFHQMGYGIDWLFTYTLLNREPDEAVYPCWMMSTMLMAVLGYIMPSVFLFLTEVSHRAVFVQSRVSHKLHHAVFSYANDAYRFGWMACATALIASWFFLSLARTLAY